MYTFVFQIKYIIAEAQIWRQWSYNPKDKNKHKSACGFYLVILWDQIQF